MDLYVLDDQQVWTGEVVEHIPKTPLAGIPADPPPELTGTQVAQRRGSNWYVLDEYPTPAPPQPVIPKKVTRRQAKQALALNDLLDLVQPAIDAISDAQERQLVQIFWDDSLEFERDREELISLAIGSLGLTETQLNDLFIFAGTL